MNEIVKLSILMPVYNEGKYIEEAVESIFSYYYKNLDIELIVVDDQSTDDTYNILSELSINNSKIHVFKNIFKGKNNALNIAYLNSTGQYICFMGGDDLIEPKTLLLRVKSIVDKQLNNDDYIYSCCKIKTFSSVKKYDSIVIPKANGKGSSSGGAIVLTRALANKIFPIPNNLPNEDSWIAHYLEFFSIKRVETPEIGLYYRIHDQNSHKRGLIFDKQRDQMWARSKSILMFYNRYYEELTYQEEEKLVKRIYLETAIYSKQNLGILFSSNLSLKQKLVSLSHSSKLFYNIKSTLYKYVVGR